MEPSKSKLKKELMKTELQLAEEQLNLMQLKYECDKVEKYIRELESKIWFLKIETL